MTSHSKGIGFPKPTPRRIERQRKRRAETAWVALVRKYVVLRDMGCRSCHELGISPDNAGIELQMHEMVYRSKTRGLPIEDRVNTKNCILLCQFCHTAVHDKRLSIHIADTLRGANGKLIFKLWQRNDGQGEGLSGMRKEEGAVLD